MRQLFASYPFRALPCTLSPIRETCLPFSWIELFSRPRSRPLIGIIIPRCRKRQNPPGPEHTDSSWYATRQRRKKTSKERFRWTHVATELEKKMNGARMECFLVTKEVRGDTCVGICRPSTVAGSPMQLNQRVPFSAAVNYLSPWLFFPSFSLPQSTLLIPSWPPLRRDSASQ